MMINNLDLNLILIFGSISVTIFIVLFASSYIIVTVKNLNRRLEDVQETYHQSNYSRLSHLKVKRNSKNRKFFESVLDYFDITIYFEQAGIYESINTFVLCFFLSIAFCSALLFYFTMNLLISIVVASCLCAALLFVYLKLRKAKRMSKFNEDLPLILDTISRSLKAGYPTIAGFQAVASEMDDPVKTEFEIVVRENKLGIPIEESLMMLSERIPLLDLRMFVMSVVLHHTIGGNLSEVLDNLSKVIRERFKLLRQVQVITAEGRLSGWIMSIAPVCVFLILMLINPEYSKLLLETDIGQKMVMTVLFLQVIGMLMIQKIVNIKV